jgi:hypothetical protein
VCGVRVLGHLFAARRRLHVTEGREARKPKDPTRDALSFIKGMFDNSPCPNDAAYYRLRPIDQSPVRNASEASQAEPAG